MFCFDYKIYVYMPFLYGLLLVFIFLPKRVKYARDLCNRILKKMTQTPNYTIFLKYEYSRKLFSFIQRKILINMPSSNGNLIPYPFCIKFLYAQSCLVVIKDKCSFDKEILRP